MVATGNGFGRRLRALLEREGITQIQLAQALNTSGPLINQYIKGRKEPGIHNAKRIAEYFNIDLHWLITGYTHEQEHALSKFQTKLGEIQAKYRAERRSVYRLKHVADIIALVEQLSPAERKLVLEMLKKIAKK